MAHHPTLLEIAASGAAHAPSPEHKRFRLLLGKIDKARQRLQAWQEQLPLFAQMHQARVAPVLSQLHAARRAWATELEGLTQRTGWSRAERQTLSHMICDLCGALLEGADEPDAALKALYDRHAEVDFDTQGRQHLEAMKSLLEDAAGMDLGDAPAESVDELMARAHAQMRPGQAGSAADGQQGPHQEDEAGVSWPGARGRRSPMPKPMPNPMPKPKLKSAARQQADDAAARVAQTVRAVYRKLASALHPDRADAAVTPEQRQLLSDRMAAANSAYAAGDLLALLSLQLQIEQVDMAHAAGVAAAEVKHFNKVLAEQLREIEAEIDGRQLALCATYGFMPDRRLDPARLGLLLTDELREAELVQMALARERRQLLGDPAGAKRYLKRVRAGQQAVDRLADDFLF